MPIYRPPSLVYAGPCCAALLPTRRRAGSTWCSEGCIRACICARVRMLVCARAHVHGMRTHAHHRCTRSEHILMPSCRACTTSAHGAVLRCRHSRLGASPYLKEFSDDVLKEIQRFLNSNAHARTHTHTHTHTRTPHTHPLAQPFPMLLPPFSAKNAICAVCSWRARAHIRATRTHANTTTNTVFCTLAS